MRIPTITCFFSLLVVFLLLRPPYAANANRCFDCIISFGDSIADTGNLLFLSKLSNRSTPNFALPPYGETFFRRPTGRCSDGRLIIDFIAEYLGLPYVKPFIGGKNRRERNYEEGVNFAVVGATALDSKFFEDRGIINPFTNFSLTTQLNWFGKLLPSLCNSAPDCKKFLSRSLILMGEIGGNDYNYPLLGKGSDIQEVQSFVPLVINVIGSAIEELIRQGAQTLMVPGNFPIGCIPCYLTRFKSSNTKEYDPATGCLVRLNKFAEYHNDQLQIKLKQIQEFHPHVNIIYADYYNAAMSYYTAPQKFGFRSGEVLKACCGGGGPYNYNATVMCGYSPSKSCNDPSKFASWDGVHMTEAAYKVIAEGLLNGPFTSPALSTICPATKKCPSLSIPMK